MTISSSHLIPGLQWQLTLKELRETLRDRRTIITLLAMPLLLYPLLGLVFRTMTLKQQAIDDAHYQIACETMEESIWLNGKLDAYFHRRKSEAERLQQQQYDQPKFLYVIPDKEHQFDIQDVNRQQIVDLALKVKFDELHKFNELPRAEVELFQVSGSTRSFDACRIIQQALASTKFEEVHDWIKQQHPGFHTPFESRVTLIEPLTTTSPFLGLIPLMLLLMTVTGGVYPAIDLTAGERERDTLETLIALPISKVRILFAKYIAVLTITLLTGIMNLFAMSITVFTLQLEKSLFGEQGVSLWLFVSLLAIQIVFGMFISSVLLLVTSSARSFKEAQAYLVPILLLSMVPGLAILLPGWNLQGINIILPMVNMLLLARDVAEGHAELIPGLLAIFTTSLYTVLTLTIAGNIFGQDAFATGSRGMWRDLWSRPLTAHNKTSMNLVFQVLAVLFPLYFVASGSIARVQEISPLMRLAVSAIFTLILFVGLPWFFLWYQRIGLISAWGMHRPNLKIWPVVILLGLTTWPLIYECIFLLQSDWLKNMLTKDQLEKVQQLLASWKEVPLLYIILALGVMPGLCEELFFRGFCYEGISTQFKALPTIIITSLLFAAFHLLVSGVASPERFLPSLLMGLLLGYVRYSSGSIWPSTVLHILHNSVLLIMSNSTQQLESLLGGQLANSHLPASWIATSAGCVSLALIVLTFFKQPAPRNVNT